MAPQYSVKNGTIAFMPAHTARSRQGAPTFTAQHARIIKRCNTLHHPPPKHTRPQTRCHGTGSTFSAGVCNACRKDPERHQQPGVIPRFAGAKLIVHKLEAVICQGGKGDEHQRQAYAPCRALPIMTSYHKRASTGAGKSARSNKRQCNFKIKLRQKTKSKRTLARILCCRTAHTRKGT